MLHAVINPEANAGTRSDQGRPPPRTQGPDLLACVLEALPIGMGLFQFVGEEIVFRAGNREFARVLRLDRPPR
ncbi:MAG TPA: hypothetical protein VIT43_03490, partial [Candidatus Dormibacteraeota bacterium]